tara:strand:- start:105 stop:458 length:354 start_codon:yes stop_codon:yes gene_type:complete
MEYLKLGIIILLIDAIYLSSVSGKFSSMIKDIQNKKVSIRYGSVIVCYILIIYLLHHFIISPKKSLIDAFILGICVYGIFDTVNYAIFDKYKLHLAIIDTLWGGTLFTLATHIFRSL